jgi:two-component system, LuxR family, response regulator FixJ
MPGVTGVELLRQVRSQGFPLPAIIMTGSSDSILREQVAQAGVFALLEKPIPADVLLSTIEKALDTWQPQSRQTA